MSSPIRAVLAATGLVGCWIVFVSCSEPADPVPLPPRTGVEAVERLIALSRTPDPDAEALAGVLDPKALEADRVAALEALEALGRVVFSSARHQQDLAGLGRQVVELEGGLPGEGSATYAFQVEERESGSWQVTSFRGPGVGWPPRAPVKGPGLSTSAPPGDE